MSTNDNIFIACATRTGCIAIMASSSVVVLGREPSLSPKGSSENSPFLGDAISLDNDISDDFPISALPRIPQKNHQKLKCEYLRGIGVVEGSCVVTLTTCHGLAWACNFEPYQLWLPIMIFTRVVSVVAVACHALIMFGDPGTVFRSRETCYPVPPVVAERLRAGDKLDDLDNVRGEEWSSYCVRCCVWRRQVPLPQRKPSYFHSLLPPRFQKACMCVISKRAHHCSVCQICTTDFDHHCGVLGKCIAGNNYTTFQTLIVCAHSAPIVSMCAVLLAIVQHYGFSDGMKYAIGGSLLLFLTIGSQIFTPIGIPFRVAIRWIVNLHNGRSGWRVAPSNMVRGRSLAPDDDF